MLLSVSYRVGSLNFFRGSSLKTVRSLSVHSSQNLLSREHVSLFQRESQPLSPFSHQFQFSVARHFATDIKKPDISQDDAKTNEKISTEKPAQPTLFQRFKQMSKDYWYVLIPVHIITSVGWFGGFYFAVKSGLDVVAVLESLGVSEKIVNPLKGSSAGYVALAYAMYKAATPARYAVTLGGTTASINYLTRWGYIKPVPSKEKLQLLYNVRKEKFNTQRDAFRRKLRQHKAELRKKVAIKKPVKK